MPDSIVITGSTTGIDLSRWRKLTPQEIIREESKGEEIPPEIVSWAQQMAAFANIPDNVTYEEVDGDVGIEALNRLGLYENGEEIGAQTAENAVAPEETETPQAVEDITRTEELGEETTEDENIFMNPTPGFAAEAPQTTVQTQEKVEKEQQLTLADPSITTDPEEIRKRRARRGLE